MQNGEQFGCYKHATLWGILEITEFDHCEVPSRWLMPSLQTPWFGDAVEGKSWPAWGPRNKLGSSRSAHCGTMGKGWCHPWPRMFSGKLPATPVFPFHTLRHLGCSASPSWIWGNTSVEVQTSKGPQETATLGRTAATDGLLTISVHWPLRWAAIRAVTPGQDLQTEASSKPACSSALPPDPQGSRFGPFETRGRKMRRKVRDKRDGIFLICALKPLYRDE